MSDPDPIVLTYTGEIRWDPREDNDLYPWVAYRPDGSNDGRWAAEQVRIRYGVEPPPPPKPRVEVTVRLTEAQMRARAAVHNDELADADEDRTAGRVFDEACAAKVAELDTPEPACPEHGDHCTGPWCCCVDRHRAAVSGDPEPAAVTDREEREWVRVDAGCYRMAEIMRDERVTVATAALVEGQSYDEIVALCGPLTPCPVPADLLPQEDQHG